MLKNLFKGWHKASITGRSAALKEVKSETEISELIEDLQAAQEAASAELKKLGEQRGKALLKKFRG